MEATEPKSQTEGTEGHLPLCLSLPENVLAPSSPQVTPSSQSLKLHPHTDTPHVYISSSDLSFESQTQVPIADGCLPVSLMWTKGWAFKFTCSPTSQVR